MNGAPVGREMFDAAIRLRVQQVSKRWSAGSALRPVSFDVSAGEFVVVRGRSGSGKSTLLAILAGWCPAGAGEVLVDGEVRPLDRLPWHVVSVVPQVLALVPELTLHENVTCVVDGRDAAARDRVDALFRSLDLDELARRFPGEVSMGQQQRAAVARAVAVGAGVVLADEPTSHQDREHADSVVTALLAAAQQGSAVVVASHDPAVVAAAHTVVDLDV
ncbi:MAG: ATP-binding cassette domain-containing protein [Acidimicrobiales bacterium]